MTDDLRCRHSNAGVRCDYRGTRDQILNHTLEVDHPRCCMCQWPLTEYETQTCTRCVTRVRDDVAAVATAYAHLERVVAASGYRTNRLPGGDPLVYLADGSIERAMHAYETTEPQPHPLARPDDQGPPPPIRDEWTSDPMSVLAVLEAEERGWHRQFAHQPSDEILTVRRALHYLLTWHHYAAQHHPGFDDYATTIRELRSRLEHTVGLADDPLRAPAECFDCGGQLVRNFTEPAEAVADEEHDCDRCGRRHAGRHGTDGEGLTDDWICRDCRRVYDQASYFLALRAVQDSCEGWVPVKVAAAVLRRHESVIWRWVAVDRVTSRHDGTQTLVEWTEVLGLSQSSQRRERRTA